MEAPMEAEGSGAATIEHNYCGDGIKCEGLDFCSLPFHGGLLKGPLRGVYVGPMLLGEALDRQLNAAGVRALLAEFKGREIDDADNYKLLMTTIGCASRKTEVPMLVGEIVGFSFDKSDDGVDEARMGPHRAQLIRVAQMVRRLIGAGLRFGKKHLKDGTWPTTLHLEWRHRAAATLLFSVINDLHRCSEGYFARLVGAKSMQEVKDRAFEALLSKGYPDQKLRGSRPKLLVGVKEQADTTTAYRIRDASPGGDSDSEGGDASSWEREEGPKWRRLNAMSVLKQADHNIRTRSIGKKTTSQPQGSEQVESDGRAAASDTITTSSATNPNTMLNPQGEHSSEPINVDPQINSEGHIVGNGQHSKNVNRRSRRGQGLGSEAHAKRLAKRKRKEADDDDDEMPPPPFFSRDRTTVEPLGYKKNHLDDGPKRRSTEGHGTRRVEG